MLEFLDVTIGQTNQDGIAVIKVQNAKSKNECLCGFLCKNIPYWFNFIPIGKCCPALDIDMFLQC